MKTTRLFIIRHGETEANIAQVLQGISHGELTINGRSQATKLGLSLKHEKFDVIFGSDLRRVKQTLEPIIEHHSDIPVNYLDLIREWNVGIFDLKPKDEYRVALKNSGETQALFRPSKGENYYDVAERAKKFLNMLMTEYEGKNILICSHGDFIRILISILLEQSIENATEIPQDNTALSVFELSDTGVKQIVLNSTEHLSN